jgi:hypothetical protein
MFPDGIYESIDTRFDGPFIELCSGQLAQINVLRSMQNRNHDFVFVAKMMLYRSPSNARTMSYLA